MEHVPVEAFQAVEEIPNAFWHAIEINKDLGPESTAESVATLASGTLPTAVLSYDVEDRQSEQLPVGGPKPWWARRTVDGKRVSRVLTREERSEGYTAWRHARARGTPLNRLVTVKPSIDDLNPVARGKRWDRFRQRVRCHCRACQFEAVMLSTRESSPADNTGEHLHLLLHVPPEEQERFDRLVVGWDENVDVRPATMHERVTPSGKVKSAASYILKAACPQDRRRDPSIWYRPSGAVAGSRIFLTRNLRKKARDEFETRRAAKLRVHRERSTIQQPVAPQATEPA